MYQKKGRGGQIREAKEFEEEVIQIDRVTRVVKGGRRLRFRATVAIGNHKGKVGVGIGKSTEVQGAIQKAISQARKTLIQVPMVGQTIPHRIKVKYKSARMLLMPACPGTGIIAGGPLRKIIELSGVKDVMSKSFGSNNRLSNSQAAILALSQLHIQPWITKKTAAAAAVVAAAKQEVKATEETGTPAISKTAPASKAVHVPKVATPHKAEVKAATGTEAKAGTEKKAEPTN